MMTRGGEKEDVRKGKRRDGLHEEEERAKVGLDVRPVRNERRVKPVARRAGGVFEWIGRAERGANGGLGKRASWGMRRKGW